LGVAASGSHATGVPNNTWESGSATSHWPADPNRWMQLDIKLIQPLIIDARTRLR